MVEGFDAGFGGFRSVEVGVDGAGLGFAEADEVDYVGEDFDEAFVRGFEEVGEGEVVDAALEVSCVSLYGQHRVWVASGGGPQIGAFAS